MADGTSIKELAHTIKTGSWKDKGQGKVVIDVTKGDAKNLNIFNGPPTSNGELLGQHELERALGEKEGSNLRGKSEEEIEKILSKFDKTGDGSLSREETKICRERAAEEHKATSPAPAGKEAPAAGAEAAGSAPPPAAPVAGLAAEQSEDTKLDDPTGKSIEQLQSDITKYAIELLQANTKIENLQAQIQAKEVAEELKAQLDEATKARDLAAANLKAHQAELNKRMVEDQKNDTTNALPANNKIKFGELTASNRTIAIQ